MTSAGEPRSAVWVFAERLHPILELLTIGRRLADQRGLELATLTVDAAGFEESADGPRRRAEASLAHGADRSLLLTPETSRELAADVVLAALVHVVQAEPVAILLISATTLGTEVAARLAQRLHVGCASECLAMEASGDGLVVERRDLGRFLSRQLLTSKPAIATVPPRRFDPAARRTGPGAASEPEVGRFSAPPPRTRVIGSKPRAGSETSLRDATALVAVGRGLRSPEDLELVHRLAEAVGGVVAASRPLTDDLEWLPTDVKVGLSGQTVQPELYVACGISGQIEHVVGMRDSRFVVAINSDPRAPIMQEADLCLVGDLYQLVPALTAAIQRRRATR